MKPNNQSSSVACIAKLLRDNPILGAGSYPEAARLTANSCRLQRDLQRELEYYREHPDCDNVRIWHCVHQSKFTSYWVNRWGKFALRKKSTGMRLLKIDHFLSPARRRSGNSVPYCMICLCVNNSAKDLYLHAVMSDIFIPNVDFTKTERDHINGNHFDNNAFNLERVTPEENRRRKYYNYYASQGRPVPAKFLPYPS